MVKRKGRAYRRRKRRVSPQRRGSQGLEAAANISHELDYVQLRKWLKKKGFNDFYLVPANFPDIGRGLMTTKALQPGDLVIKLPEKCLLTTTTVLSSYLGEYIERWKPRLSPLQALCTFLISERHFGSRSSWKPYIDVLPKTYTCPVYLAEEVISLFPCPLVKRIQQQKSEVQELYLTSQCFFSSLQPLFSQPTESVFTYHAFRWAWCSINTRTVYMEHEQSEFLSRQPDVYALAPYLDLLNHSPSAQVTAAFNRITRHYEIRTVTKCKRYEQVFICYGPHDNQRLLLEYGFLASSNPHNVVNVDKDLLCNHISQKDKLMDRKMLFLQDEGLLGNLTFGLDGPSWRLLTVLKVFCLRTEEYLQRKNILVGLSVSADNERSSLELAENLCSQLMNENLKAMQEISKLLNETGDVSEQLEVVATVRREELKILQASAEVLQNMRVATPR
ncbi:SET domain-containing protein 4 isoform X2 [Scyliorhinus canicula]|uniref:SET domain-containing protein 4 isoform X2 n=1 Tax=Scyliorhinus canicula TaxID=7830 RepID=UPI0018F6C0F3|nr:SET domain-containing protein 4 isoform X2 [Scyliorhinus canicula]